MRNTGLTESQRDAARKASEGLSNAEIAQRMCVSIHTVERYLHDCYEVFGITGNEGSQTQRVKLTRIMLGVDMVCPSAVKRS